jgi:hypothetical protein
MPLSPLSSIAIALIIAACALAILRHRRASGFVQWCLLIATGGVGPCSIGAPPNVVPGAVQQFVAPECTVGLPVDPAGFCVVTIVGGAG